MDFDRNRCSSMNSQDSIVSPQTAATMLGVSKKTLANWRSSGAEALKFIKIGSKVAYRAVDLDEYLCRKTYSSTSQYKRGLK